MDIVSEPPGGPRVDASSRGVSGRDVSGDEVSGDEVSGGDFSGGDFSGDDVSGGVVASDEVSGGDVSGGGSWLSFFGGGHRVLEDPELLRARYERCVEDLIDLLVVRPGLRLLDFGCGDALAAGRLLEAGVELSLYDGTPSVVEGLRRRYADRERPRVLSPEQYRSLSPLQFDAVVVHSVIQYIPRDALPALLATWFTLLEPGGVLILSDVPTREGRMADDALSLLRFGVEVGKTVATLRCLMQTLLSSYRGLLRGAGLTRYGEEELCARLSEAGFQGEVLPRNPGPLTARRAFRARRPSPAR